MTSRKLGKEFVLTGSLSARGQLTALNVAWVPNYSIPLTRPQAEAALRQNRENNGRKSKDLPANRDHE